MKLRFLSLILAATFVASSTARAEPPPADAIFRAEVEGLIKRLDDARMAPGSIAFLGSSSIRLWRTLRADFPDREVINAGFGGSTIHNWLFYGPRLISRINPAAVVLYVGENDLATGSTPAQAFEDLSRLYHLLRIVYPAVPVAVLAVKTSPSRTAFTAAIDAYNALARGFLVTRDHATFLDAAAELRGPDGAPRPEFFQADGLHLSASGYAIFRRHVATFLAARVPASVTAAKHPAAPPP